MIHEILRQNVFYFILTKIIIIRVFYQRKKIVSFIQQYFNVYITKQYNQITLMFMSIELIHSFHLKIICNISYTMYAT